MRILRPAAHDESRHEQRDVDLEHERAHGRSETGGRGRNSSRYDDTRRSELGPQIAGTAVTASAGAWSNNPASYAYQWEQCVQSNLAGQQCAPISGATSSSYTLRPSDVGNTVAVRVTATNASGPAPATSLQTGVVGAPGTRTYYVAAANDGGSDGNPGTKSAPWAHAPGMQGCAAKCARYRAAAGDRFVFKGGDTWGNANFPLATGSGVAGKPDYYGIETDWYTGLEFSRPTFDAQDADICPGSCSDSNVPGGAPDQRDLDVFIDASQEDYVTVDGLHLTNYSATRSTRYHICSEILSFDDGDSRYDQNIALNRLLIDKIRIGATSDASTCYILQNYSVPYANDNDIFENSTVAGDSTTWGKGLWYEANAVNNVIYGIGEGLIYPASHGTIAGNRLYGCAANPTTGAPQAPSIGGGPTTTIHDNAIETLGVAGSGTFYIYDNVIYNTGETSNDECESLILSNTGETDYVYNNVLYHIGGNGPDSGTTSGGTPKAAYYWNNSIQSSNADNVCVRAPGTPTFVAQNNLCVGSGGISGNGTIDHNVQIAAVTAARDGYTGLGGKFIWPTPGGSSPTTGAGANLTSHCSSVPDLCATKSYANARTSIAGAKAGAWDVGAYEVPAPLGAL